MDSGNIINLLSDATGVVNSLLRKRDELQHSIAREEKLLLKYKSLLDSLEETRIAINNEIQAIQVTLKEDIDSLVTIAIKIVYEGRDIEFTMDFDRTPSGNSQYKPFIVENGEKYNPKDEQCGGALDVISYAMRIVLFTLEKNKSRKFMFFDEPFKFLGGGMYAEKAATMAKKINAEVGIQCLMISHDEMTISTADRIYNIDHNGKNSTTTLLGAQETQETKEENKIKRIKGPKRIKA